MSRGDEESVGASRASDGPGEAPRFLTHQVSSMWMMMLRVAELNH